MVTADHTAQDSQGAGGCAHLPVQAGEGRAVPAQRLGAGGNSPSGLRPASAAGSGEATRRPRSAQSRRPAPPLRLRTGRPSPASADRSYLRSRAEVRLQPKRPRWRGERPVPPEARTRLPSSEPLGSRCDCWSLEDPGSAPPRLRRRRPPVSTAGRGPGSAPASPPPPCPPGSVWQVRARFRVPRLRRRGSPPVRTCAARRPAGPAGEAPPPARGPGARRTRGSEDPRTCSRARAPAARRRAGPAPPPLPAPVRPRQCPRAGGTWAGQAQTHGRGKCRRKDGNPGNPEGSQSTGDSWVGHPS
ncbi:uncharacterized protein LOC144612828 [Panthera onca]